jgi:hypothetical protein
MQKPTGAAGYTVIPPKQKYMTVDEIRAAFKSRGVVAYACKVLSGVPLGGFVIAVQEKPDSRDIKEYMRQFKKKFRDREPVYYIRMEKEALVYDGGSGELRTVRPIEVKTEPEKTPLDDIPFELIALALSTALHMDNADE